MDGKIQIPEIPEEELTPTVKALLNVISQCVEVIEAQKLEIRQLKDEIAKLKGTPPKPRLRPSTLDSEINSKKSFKKKGRRKKPREIKIDHEKRLKAKNVPKGSIFKGYKTYTVFDIILQPNIIRYHREDWETPDGRRILANLPAGICGHYGPSLREYILNLYYGLNVPLHLIVQNLNEHKIPISKGQVLSIVTDNHEKFHNEKELLLGKGLKEFPYLSVDDTGARHKGRNGFCTHIGNEFFSYFKSTKHKSRVNFLKILRGKEKDYVFTQESFDYMKLHNLKSATYNRLEGALGRVFKDENEWNHFVKKMVGLKYKKEIRIVTEAALLGSIFKHGINTDMIILSDEAGQFDILLRALCWLHAERKITSIIPVNDYQSEIIDDIRTEIWAFYNSLKIYQTSPDSKMKEAILLWFDKLFAQKTDFKSINQALELIYKNKKGLLVVLERPEVPLHNNISENSIRCMVTKRKIHGGTRSDPGRQCRDTFMSLKKTCLKLGISFHEYLHDRITGENNIPLLHEIMLQKAASVV